MNHLIRIIVLFLITWQSALAVSYGVNLGAGGEGGGAPGYTNVGSFPVTASDGDQAIDLSSGDLYVYTSGSWQLIGSPTVVAAIGAINGQAKNAQGGAVVGNTIYLQSADSIWPGLLTAADWSTFNSKEPAISAGTALQYWRGDKTFQTLDTAAVPENTNLYFTDARARTAAVADAINNGTTNIAPSQNAVFDALALKIDLTEKGANNGVATLDAGGKIPAAQLPNTVMEYQGAWNATTNTPALADGAGSAGDVYLVSVAGTQNLGSGAITFAAGDWAVYNGTTWEKTINSNAVVSVNGQQGVVSLDTDDISEGATNLYHTNARAIGSTLTGYSAGAGIVSAADSVLSAIQKLDGNIAAKFTLPTLTAGSVLFSDGSTIAQDNANFFWDDAANTLSLRGGTFQFGTVDAFARRQIWNYSASSILRLGSSGQDGDATNVASEGAVIYGNSLTNQPISATDVGYARVKHNRFGLFTVDSTLPAYAGGDYFFRVDDVSMYLKNNSAAKTFEVTRTTGQIDTALGAGVVHSDASGVLSSSSVVNADMANMANNTIKGNDSGGAAAPQDLTGTEVTALLDTFTAGLKGLAPASGGGTSNFLRADGTWAAPAGAGDVVGPASATDEALVRYDGTTGKLIQNSAATLTDAGVLTASSFVGPLTGNSSTATALAANPTDCGAGTKATAIDASGNLTCSAVALAADVSGTLPAANGGYGTAIQEAATGSINNSNTAFTLSQTPVSAASVALYKNGRLLIQGTDYTIAGVNITMTVAPDFAELLRAVYRY